MREKSDLDYIQTVITSLHTYKYITCANQKQSVLVFLVCVCVLKQSCIKTALNMPITTTAKGGGSPIVHIQDTSGQVSLISIK